MFLKLRIEVVSLEFVSKTESCIKNLVDFLQICKIFTHIIIIDNHRISKFKSLDLAILLKKLQNKKIIYTLSLSSNDIDTIKDSILEAKKSKIDGVIFVSGEKNAQNQMQNIMQESIIMAKKEGLMVLSATNNIQNIKERINFGVDGIITQSFYSKYDFLNFLKNFEDESNKIIPSFFPFFNDEILKKWHKNTLGINIPSNYQIYKNKEIFRDFLKFKNLHISMMDSNFSNILTMI